MTAAASADHVQVVNVDATAKAVGGMAVFAVVTGIDVAAVLGRRG